LYATISSTIDCSIPGSVTATAVCAITVRRVRIRAISRSALRVTERRRPELTSSNGRPTNCAIRRPGSTQRTMIEPCARRVAVCCVAGITKLVVTSNDVSTGAVDTKYAPTGRDGSGVRQRWRPGPSRSPTSHDGHITTTSSSPQVTSMSSGPSGNGHA
jgi:hypothetical protein